MSDNEAKWRRTGSSIDESLDLLGLSPSGWDRSLKESVAPTVQTARPASPLLPAGFLSTEIIRDPDGVRRLHVLGCGRQPIRLSRSRCKALLRGWTQLQSFASRGGRVGTSLTDQITIREVNDIIVVEIRGEVGRPVRFTPEKLAKLLRAEAAIRQFSA